MLYYLLISISAFILTLVLTYGVIKLADTYGFVVHPSENRWHKRPTAQLGGVAIVTSMLIMFLIFNSEWTASIITLLASFTILFLVGLKDDVSPFRPKAKLLFQILTAILTILAGVYFETGLGLGVNYIITVFWIVGIINAVNLIDNMDGLSNGVIFVTSSTFLAFSVITDHDLIIAVSLIVLGATFGFLMFNFKPAKIFMGDSGSLPLGYLMAIISISIPSALQMNGTIIGSLLIPVLLLIVPIFDTTLVMVDRKLKGKKISQGGKDHLSHRLANLLNSEKKAVVLIYCFGFIFASVSLLIYSLDQVILLGVSFLVLSIIIGFIYLLRYLEKNEKQEKVMEANEYGAG